MKTDTTKCQQLKRGRIHYRQIDDTSSEVLRLNVDRNFQGRRIKLDSFLLHETTLRFTLVRNSFIKKHNDNAFVTMGIMQYRWVLKPCHHYWFLCVLITLYWYGFFVSYELGFIAKSQLMGNKYE